MMKKNRYFKQLLVVILLMILPSVMTTAKADLLGKDFQRIDSIWYHVDFSTRTATVVSITGQYTSLTIPSYITVIDRTTFKKEEVDCRVTCISTEQYLPSGTLEVDTLIIPATVRKIDDDAFNEITTPTTLKFLGNSVFDPIEMGCVSSDGSALFSPLSNLTSVILDRNISYSNPSAKKPFEGLSKLTTVEIGNNVDSISTDCFRGSSIMSVALPSQSRLCAINSGAFSKCSNLKSLTLPKCSSGPQNIMSGAFTSSGLYNIITLGYVSIQSKAFESCTSMKAVAFCGRTDVASEAFASCSAIEEVHFEGDSTIFLADKSFSNCTSVKLVTINHRQTPDDLSEGVSTAFSQTTYDNATFVNYGDDAFNKVDLSQTEPWRNFKNVRQSTNATLDIYNPQSMLGTEFSNIKMPYTIKKGQCELFCLPFDIDTYYFGSDATIYTMSQDNINHVKKLPYDYFFTDVNVYYNKVDIDKTETIPACTPFLVIPQRNDSLIQATIDLFKTNMVKFTSRDSVYTWYGDYDLEEWNNTYSEASASQQRFIVIDGCLKRVNNINYVIPAYTPTLYATPNSTAYFSPHYMDGSMADSVTCILRDSIMTTPNELLSGYTTFFSNESNFEIPTEDYQQLIAFPEIYTVTGISGGQLVLDNVEDFVINKGEAVLIKCDKKAAGKPFRLRMVTDKSIDTKAYENNLLKGVDVDTPVSELCSAGSTGVYALSTGNVGVGFYHVETDRTMPANKAYLEALAVGSKSNPTCFLIGTGASGIEDVTSANKSDGTTYDLSGRRVGGKLRKGIYIKDNRKEVVR